jgi:hypothetical protein
MTDVLSVNYLRMYSTEDFGEQYNESSKFLKSEKSDSVSQRPLLQEVSSEIKFYLQQILYTLLSLHTHRAESGNFTNHSEAVKGGTEALDGRTDGRTDTHTHTHTHTN